MNLTFIETPIFTKEIQRYLSDYEYHLLQKELLFRPDAGDVIKGGGGLRKLRWKRPGMGKSGGLRIIYYFQQSNTIYMLYPYCKNRQENLTQEQLKYFRNIMKEYLL